MPRPKRTKLAPSVPIVPAAIASRKPQSRPDVSPAVSSTRGTSGSDDSEGVVSKSKAGVNRRGIAPQPVFMTGALAAEDVGAHRSQPVPSWKRVELSKIAREGDYAKVRKGQEDRRKANVALEQQGRTAEYPERQMQSTQTAKAQSQKIPYMQIAKTHPTPLKENSVLALENFKRRPRQPSILRIAQAHNAAAEPANDDTLDGFTPDDESTPFRNPRLDSQHGNSSTLSGHSSSRKRKLSTPEIQVPASQIPDSPNPSSSPPPSQPDDLFDMIAEDSQPNPPLLIRASASPTPKPVDSDTMAPPQSSSLPSSPQKLKPNGQPKSRYKKAPLASKSKPKLAKSTLREEPHPTLHPRSPSTTTTLRNRSPPKPLTTSALQNLLPRRRRHLASTVNKENTVFDLNASSEIDSFEANGDEDELNYHHTTKIARKPRNEKAKKSMSKAKGGSKKGKSEANSLGNKKQGQGHARQSMTYTRKVQHTSHTGNDENEPVESGDDDESGEDGVRSREGVGALMDAKARQEMKKMAAKFREVDDWGLEFEEVTGSSDRMRDAR
ncbi:MAG: hypothetical protein Q9169_000109 [Polycauliona sp. 2 TL-2023]